MFPTAGGIDSAMETNDLYAPPKAGLTMPSGPPSLRWRFWTTCLFFAFAMPVLLYGMGMVSAWPRVFIASIAWLAGAGWILLPRLHHDVRSEWDLTYMAVVAIGFPACTALMFFGLASTGILAFVFASFFF